MALRRSREQLTLLPSCSKAGGRQPLLERSKKWDRANDIRATLWQMAHSLPHSPSCGIDNVEEKRGGGLMMIIDVAEK